MYNVVHLRYSVVLRLCEAVPTTLSVLGTIYVKKEKKEREREKVMQMANLKTVSALTSFCRSDTETTVSGGASDSDWRRFC